MGFFENAKNGGNGVSPAGEAQRLFIVERRDERTQKSVTREYARKKGKVRSLAFEESVRDKRKIHGTGEHVIYEASLRIPSRIRSEA